jgi:hypothetical protein
LSYLPGLSRSLVIPAGGGHEAKMKSSRDDIASSLRKIRGAAKKLQPELIN